VDARPVAALQVGAADALLRVLRVEEERKPVDPRAVPALQPLGPREADVAERSRVVAPDRDGERFFQIEITFKKINKFSQIVINGKNITPICFY
jgi:hypothetical protein